MTKFDKWIIICIRLWYTDAKFERITESMYLIQILILRIIHKRVLYQQIYISLCVMYLDSFQWEFYIFVSLF